MEYKQITLTEWLDIKKKLKEDISSARDKINGLKKDFVRIGYLLRKIDDNKLYEQDGYKSIAEFAKKECNLSPSDVSRFIKINKRYSIDGNSPELREEFLEYGQSKLAAMLTLPDSDLAMIDPQTSREDIRELNRFNKSAPNAEETEDDMEDVIRDFYVSEGIIKKAVAVKDNPKDLRELIAPSGSKSFRKGRWIFMFHENRINVRKFPEQGKEITWPEFVEITAKVLEKYELEEAATRKENVDGFKGDSESNKQDSAGSGRDNEQSNARAGGDVRKTEGNKGVSEPQQSETEHETDNNIPEESSKENMGYTEKSEREENTEKEVIAPAQKTPEPAIIPSRETDSKEETKPVLRWEKMQHMSIPEVAEMLHLGYKSHHLTFSSITDVENWLNEKMEK